MTPKLYIRRQNGVALIGLVAAILLFSVLAAAIVPMVSSSSEQTAAANLTSKAYLLAESGYRYASSKFLHAGTTVQAQNIALENLDGDYDLNGNDGSFNLQVFSYFYELTADVNGETQFVTHVPGSFPGAGSLPDDPGDEVALDSALKLQINGDPYTLTAGSAPVNGFDDRVIFFVTPALATYPAGTPVYPAADVDLIANTTLSEGGNLAYEAGDGRMFPLRNGNIQVNGRTLNYRFNDRNSNQFVDVRAATPPAMANFDLLADPKIVLTRYVRLHATGTYGSDGMQAERRVVYYTPLPPDQSSVPEQEYSDPFDTGDNWADTAGTDTGTRIVDGDSVLTVDSSLVGVNQKGGLTTFSPDPGSDAGRAINFGASQRGSLGYLNYDTQIKIGYEIAPAPTQGFFPLPPFPAYVGAGISFRLTNDTELFNNNGYGLSFLRGNNSLLADNIPDELVPLQNERAIVLWRQTGNGSQRTWLAYKRLIDLVFDEANEDPNNNQFNAGTGPTDLWDLEPVDQNSIDRGRQRGSSTRNWYYGIGAEHTYDWKSPPFVGSSIANTGVLQSNEVNLPTGVTNLALTFWSWHETEPGRKDTHDLKEIVVVGSPTVTYRIDSTPPAPTIITPPGADGWYQAQIDLSAYAGQTIRLRFEFDSVDELNNVFEGWYVDDIQISYQWPVQYPQEATLALSLKEAMVVRFTNGTAQIRKGDRLLGGSGGTVGTVLIPPLISSGSWGGSPPASGTLLLNSTTVLTTGDAFSSGEQLHVLGNTGRAEVDTWDSGNDEKANIIQAYVAAKAGAGSGGNSNPLDINTEPYGRIGLASTPLTELQWPPVLDDSGSWTDNDGSWSSAEDYFRQIEWDVINTTVSGLFAIPFTPSGEDVVERAILQNHHPTLRTPDYPGIYEATELGLHSFGDGAENVYFDDFGIRLNVLETDILPTPVQQ